MPSWIGRKLDQSPETSIFGAGDEIVSRPIHFQNDKYQDQSDKGKSQPEPSNSNAQNENTKFYKYRVLRDLELYVRMYRAGLGSLSPGSLDDEVGKRNLQLLEGRHRSQGIYKPP